MGRLFGLLLVILNISFSVVFAEETVSTNKPAAHTEAVLTPSLEKDVTYLICKNKTAVRTLRVQTRKNGTCFTTYTKNGVDQIVSSSKESQTCTKVLGNIRENLEKASWKCKDISEARVSSFVE